MRTTLDLPDDLYRELKARAAWDGVCVKELLTRYVAMGLHGAAASAERTARQRSAIPVVREATGRTLPMLSNSELQRVLEDEDAGVTVD